MRGWVSWWGGLMGGDEKGVLCFWGMGEGRWDDAEDDRINAYSTDGRAMDSSPTINSPPIQPPYPLSHLMFLEITSSTIYTIIMGHLGTYFYNIPISCAFS